MSSRANNLADRIDQGAALLASFVHDLSDTGWKTVVHPDGRTVGVLVHHIASMYPIEMGLVDRAVAGNAIDDVTWKDVAQINADHARAYANVTKAEALDLLSRNSLESSNAVRRLSDADLDRVVPFSLSFDAPVTVQYIIEDHPLRHPWHHLARMYRALGITHAAFATAA